MEPRSDLGRTYTYHLSISTSRDACGANGIITCGSMGNVGYVMELQGREAYVQVGFWWLMIANDIQLFELSVRISL